MTPEQWEKVIAVNLNGVLNCTFAALPSMQEAGYGRIVNIASEAGRVGSKGSAVYSAAKGGVISFTPARYCPVRELAFPAICLGAPVATTCPPSRPAPGPRSTT